jgi:hypothetical protein
MPLGPTYYHLPPRRLRTQVSPSRAGATAATPVGHFWQPTSPTSSTLRHQFA